MGITKCCSLETGNLQSKKTPTNLACHSFGERWKLGDIGVSNIVDEQIIAQGADRMDIGFLGLNQADRTRVTQ